MLLDNVAPRLCVTVCFQKTFGGTPGSNQQHKTITALTNENDHLKQQNIRLSEEMQTLRKALQKV